MRLKSFKAACIVVSCTAIISCNNRVGAAPAQQEIELTTAAQNYIKTFLSNEGKSNYPITAMTLTMSCNATVSGTATAGTMGVNNPNPVPLNALFRIGSITKSFVSVIILNLADEGKLSLDDTIGKYFPQYPEWSNITVRQMLNMTSGLQDDDGILGQLPISAFDSYIDPVTQILNPLSTMNLLFPSGNGWSYSNPDYILLALLVEQITGQPFETSLTKYITGPNKLNLTNTFFVRNLPSQTVNPNLVVNNLCFDCFNHQPEVDWTNKTLSFDFGAGNILSTSQDISKYVYGLFTPGVLLSNKEFQQLTTWYSLQNGQQVNGPTATASTVFGLGVSAIYLSNNHQFLYQFTGVEPGYYVFSYAVDPDTNHAVSFAINGYPANVAYLNIFIGNVLDSLGTICQQ